MEVQDYALTRACTVTLVPAGDRVQLPEGTEVFVTQALGGSVTIRTEFGLFRMDAADLSALGPEAEERFAPAPQEPSAEAGALTEDLVWETLKGCYDPEIPINIVDLGLIYDLVLDTEKATVDAKMTLTAQGCGMGPTIAADAKTKLEALPQVTEASVDIVWEPPWTPEMISENGRKTLGL